MLEHCKLSLITHHSSVRREGGREGGQGWSGDESSINSQEGGRGLQISLIK